MELDAKRFIEISEMERMRTGDPQAALVDASKAARTKGASARGRSGTGCWSKRHEKE